MRETFTSGSVGRAPGNRCLYPEGVGCNKTPNTVTPYSIDLSVPRASSTGDLSLGIRHKVDLQPLMESRRNALKHGERMTVVVGVF